MQDLQVQEIKEKIDFNIIVVIIIDYLPRCEVGQRLLETAEDYCSSVSASDACD